MYLREIEKKKESFDSLYKQGACSSSDDERDLILSRRDDCSISCFPPNFQVCVGEFYIGFPLMFYIDDFFLYSHPLFRRIDLLYDRDIPLLRRQCTWNRLYTSAITHTF